MDIDTRAKQLQELGGAIDIAERLCQGPYMIGERMSTADAALFPHFVFMTEFLPRYFGWPDVFHDRPKLRQWWEAVRQDANVARVRPGASQCRFVHVAVGLQLWPQAQLVLPLCHSFPSQSALCVCVHGGV